MDEPKTKTISAAQNFLFINNLSPQLPGPPGRGRPLRLNLYLNHYHESLSGRKIIIQMAVQTDVNVLSETPEWFVVNKPAGWLTIPGRGHAEAPVLLEWVRKLKPDAMVVHRLDLQTSGVVLFARGADAHRKANQWFSHRETKKSYLLLASGVPSAPILKITQPIEGTPATTQVEIKESFQEGFLASARPVTGRRHQIRIHLKSKGHPLWGDAQYEGLKEILFPSSSLVISRVALHASKLELPSGEKFEAPLPEDFSSWLSELRNKGSKNA
jgi:23S rRNA-/tRNA-specific pseudouridylate synthase